MSSGVGFYWWWASCAAGVHWKLAGRLGPSAFIGVCGFCISLSTAGQWALMCGGGVHWWCEGACLPGWFSVCPSMFGLVFVCAGCARHWWDSLSVNMDVFRYGWCGHSEVGLGAVGYTWDIFITLIFSIFY